MLIGFNVICSYSNMPFFLYDQFPSDSALKMPWINRNIQNSTINVSASWRNKNYMFIDNKVQRNGCIAQQGIILNMHVTTMCPYYIYIYIFNASIWLNNCRVFFLPISDCLSCISTWRLCCCDSWICECELNTYSYMICI